MNSSPRVPGLQTIAAREAVLLAPWAMRSADSRGRKYPETEHPYRGPFQRDRDRVVHSSAFRRLSGKMQVFTGDMGDYHRTRLTHTHEVASIARTIGRALRLNEDLIEALALFHDIGHPPFGHAGEDALNSCLADCGGFSHNRYALTIAEELEIRYQSFPGLNLSHEVLESQATRVDKQAAGNSPLLEAQVVDVADSMTYDAHDTDDSVKLELVTIDELAEIPLIRETVGRVHQRFGTLRGDLLRKAVVHELIDRQVTDVLQTAGQVLSQRRFESADEARRSGYRMAPSGDLAEQKAELESFLYQRVYRHPRLVEVRRRAQDRLHSMFMGYCRRSALLPPEFRARAELVGIGRTVGEYLAGMTDRYCVQQYELYFA
ncbi:MAG: dNTP triphosphohydrolase [Pirellulaceae bacterium]|nr:dNTP triphosphohydrolase [Pirellulaceae bacterium]MCU0981085.1 dNTP triphosphohydrolase [Pirellulaceae bacterium]